ncbi:MAG: hypothetical protein KGZ97_01355 [Bacteroidetes bacterium]|nr:hypothetical protein [Bacteroidota bacterium]
MKKVFLTLVIAAAMAWGNYLGAQSTGLAVEKCEHIVITCNNGTQYGALVCGFDDAERLAQTNFWREYLCGR